MADNVAITAGSGTTIRTDQVGSVHYQVVKLDGGGDGLSVPIVAGQQLANASLPVVLASDAAITVNVSAVAGNVAITAATLPLPSGAATAAKQPALGTAGTASADVLSVQGIASGTALQVCGTVTASGPLTDAQLRNSAVPVSAATLPLPADAATETTLQAVGALLAGTLTIDGSVTAGGTVAVSSVAGNVAVTAAALPLPSGAATETTLSAVNTKLAGTINVSSAAAASELHLGEVGGNAAVVKIAGSSVGVNNTTYTTGDLLGTKMNLTGALRVANGTGLVHSLTVQDLSKQKAPLDLILFDSDPSGTTFTNNAALDVADADITKIIGSISVLASDYVDFNDNAVACMRNIGLVVKGADATTSLYGAMVIRNSTANYTNNELSIAVGILRD